MMVSECAAFGPSVRVFAEWWRTGEPWCHSVHPGLTANIGLGNVSGVLGRPTMLVNLQPGPIYHSVGSLCIL